MAVQTTYDDTPAIALPGMRADSMRSDDIVSRINGESAAIEFGVLVARDGADNVADLVDNAADVAIGVSLRSMHHDMAGLDDELGIPDLDTFAVLKRGRVYVYTEDAVTEGGEVHVRIAVQDARTRIGGFRGTEDPDEDASTCLLGGARFASSAGAGELVVLELYGPLTLTADG